MVRLWVEDNGIGIAPENFERIFKIFEQVNDQKMYGGTGIGLAIVKKAALTMGGNLGVESVVGQGSRFWAEFKQKREL
jgi:signal transduction histidine kinase